MVVETVDLKALKNMVTNTGGGGGAGIQPGPNPGGAGGTGIGVPNDTSRYQSPWWWINYGQ